MVSLGWSTTLQDDVFTLFELSCCNANSGPVVTKSIQVSEDFTWTVSYKGHSVPRQSRLLHDTPSIVNTCKPSVFNLLLVFLSITVQRLLDLTSFINNAYICKGNFEEKYSSLPNIRDGVLMDQTSRCSHSKQQSCMLYLFTGTNVVGI